jgi:hypothetical protein
MKRILFLLATPLITVFASTALAAFRAYNAPPRVQAQTDQRKKQKEPINIDETLQVVDINEPESLDLEKQRRRKKHGKKYDYTNLGVAVGDTRPGGRIELISELSLKDAFPIDAVPIIVVAEATEAEAVLSGDKNSVYTEFTLLIQEVLKDDSQLKTDDVITVERFGGKVKLPSGSIIPVVANGIRMRMVGEKYLLFLNRHPLDQSIVIYTGYCLSGDTVRALDTSKKLKCITERPSIN